jgi:ketosteroid isomerase-like protein
MTVERFPGYMSDVVRRMMAAVEANDVDKTVSFFTPNALYKIGNSDPVYGPAGIKQVGASVMQMFKSVTHDIKGMWEVGTDTVVCEMELTYTRNDGKVIKLPCCDTIKLEGSMIKELRAYLDPSPLFAPDAPSSSTDNTASNLEFIKGLYAAFKRGEIQPWLDAMPDDVTWQLYGPPEIPLCGLRTGKQQVQDFLMTLVTTLEVKNSVQTKFMAEGDTVMVLGFVHSMVKATGIDFESEYAHIITVKDGKLVSYREFLDTAQLLKAYRGY